MGSLVLVPFQIALAILMFSQPERLPIETDNGTYTNPCCAPLTLASGVGRSRDVLFDYVIEAGKKGPLVLLSHQDLVVDSGHLHPAESHGQYLWVDPSAGRNWIEIDGVKFSRLRTQESLGSVARP